MAEDMLSTRSEYGRTFITSMWVLGSIAAVQIVAVGWAIITQEPPETVAVQPPTTAPEIAQPTTPVTLAGSQPPAVTETQITQSGTTTAPPQPNPLTPGLINPLSPPPIGAGSVLPAPGLGMGISPAIEPPQTSRQLPLGTALADAALSEHPVHKIKDPLMRQLVATGEELRGTGNMQGALKALRSAEAEIPQHPRVLAELAGTYSQMGLDQKAMAYWERVYELGQDGAGGYFALADMALKGNMTSAAGTTSAVLTVAGVKVGKSPATETDGEKVVLTVEIKGDSAVRPSGAEMVMNVYFFDKVDGKLIEQSTADTSQDFPTEPYDWQGGLTESITVTYHQPIFTTEQERELGKRVYHGYVIELYYRDQLQDTVAEPQELLQTHTQPSDSEPPSPEKLGPDGSLFPSGTGN